MSVDWVLNCLTLISLSSSSAVIAIKVQSYCSHARIFVPLNNSFQNMMIYISWKRIKTSKLSSCPRPATLLKKNFARFLRTPFFEHLRTTASIIVETRLFFRVVSPSLYYLHDRSNYAKFQIAFPCKNWLKFFLRYCGKLRQWNK